MITIRSGAGTSTGLVRRLNEDAMMVGVRLFVVADGMGGHAAGDVASRLAVETFEAIDTDGIDAQLIRTAVQQSTEAVGRHVDDHPECSGMGTTVAGLALLDGVAPHWAAFNVGDSRVYAFRDGVLQQVTTDHSEVQELLTAGWITPSEAATHPARNVVTRAIGGASTPETDIVMFPVGAGGRYVVCSDGLSGEVPDDEIAAVLAAHHAPQQTAEALVRMALERGGRDNITVIVVDEPPSGTPQAGSSTTNPRNQT